MRNYGNNLYVTITIEINRVLTFKRNISKLPCFSDHKDEHVVPVAKHSSYIGYYAYSELIQKGIGYQLNAIP